MKNGKVLILRATEKGTVSEEMPFDKEAGLDFYYQNLDCDTIDIVEAHGLAEFPELKTSVWYAMMRASLMVAS